MNAPAITVHRPPRYRRGNRLAVTFFIWLGIGAGLALLIIAAALLRNMPEGSSDAISLPAISLPSFGNPTLGDLMTSLRDEHDLQSYGRGGQVPPFALPPGATHAVRYGHPTTIDGAYVDFEAVQFRSASTASDYAAISGGTARGRLVLTIGNDFDSDLAAIFEAL